MISEGAFWRNIETKEVVRVDRSLLGLLSFSVLRGSMWIPNKSIWDEVEFLQKFELFQEWSHLLVGNPKKGKLH